MEVDSGTEMWSMHKTDNAKIQSFHEHNVVSWVSIGATRSSTMQSVKNKVVRGLPPASIADGCLTIFGRINRNEPAILQLSAKAFRGNPPSDDWNALHQLVS